MAREEEVYNAIADSDGKDEVIIFVQSEKLYKHLPMSKSVNVSDKLFIEKLEALFGTDNVKVV